MEELFDAQAVQHSSFGICVSDMGCIMQMVMPLTMWARLMWIRQAPHTARSSTGCPCHTRGMSCTTAAGMPAHRAMTMGAKPAAFLCCLPLALAEYMVPISEPFPAVHIVSSCAHHDMLQCSQGNKDSNKMRPGYEQLQDSCNGRFLSTASLQAGVDVATDPRAPRLAKVVQPEEIREKTGTDHALAASTFPDTLFGACILHA